MLQKTMKIIPNDMVQDIDFWFDFSYERAIDLIAFIIGTAHKYDGDIHEPGTFILEGKDFCSVHVRFKEAINYHDAKQYCREKLTDDGRITDEYEGALDRIDPGRMQSKQLLAKIWQRVNSKKV